MHCQSYWGCALECDCSSQAIALEYGLGLGKTTEKREWCFWGAQIGSSCHVGWEDGGGRIVLRVLMIHLGLGAKTLYFLDLKYPSPRERLLMNIAGHRHRGRGRLPRHWHSGIRNLSRYRVHFYKYNWQWSGSFSFYACYGGRGRRVA